MFRRTLRKCESGTPYPHIFKPLRIGNITLPNRIMMGSMHTGLEEHKEDPFGKMAHFFGERAKGGCGLIVTGGIAPYFGEDAPQIVSGKCIGSKAGHSPATPSVFDE